MKTQQTKPAGTRGYAYVRTSKEIQEKQRQRDVIARWCKDRHVEVIEWVEDSGPRDLSYKRTGWLYLQNLVQASKVDWVVIAERDRLGFADAYEYGHFIHTFRNAGVQLWCCSPDKLLTDSDDRMEPFIATLDADKSQREQGGNAERVQSSKRSRVERGEWTGGKPPYGYDLVARTTAGHEVYRLVYESGLHRRVCYYPDGTTKRYDGENNLPGRDKTGVTVHIEKTLDPTVEGWVRKIFEWFLAGYSYRKIANQLDALKVPPLYKKSWLGPTIKGILNNPTYATGVPVYNKQAHGRFLEWLDGERVPVHRVNGKAKAGRKRTSKDHFTAPPKPANAIIDTATWNAAQERIVALAAAPKTERRPRNPDLFLSGLVVCECGECMAGWAQHNAYRCSRNMRNSKLCRLNKTRHEVIEEILCQYLSECKETISLLLDHPDHCAEVWELDRQSEPLIREYTQKVTALWRQAKESGAVAPEGKEGLRVWTYEKLQSLGKEGQEKATEGLREAIEAKEAEKGRLAKRMGLVDDEEAAAAIAERLRQVTRELRELRERAKPVTDEIDALRVQLRSLLGQITRARDVMATALPLKKGEAIRKVVAQIRVKHEERRMGKLRASRLVAVEIIPAVGDPVRLPAPAEGMVGERDWDGGAFGSPERWRECNNVVEGDHPDFIGEGPRARG